MTEWWNIEEDVDDEFGAAYSDLPRPDRPTDRSFPDDLSDVDDAILSQQLTYLSSLIAYADHQLSLIEATKVGLRMRYDMQSSEQFVALGPKMPANEKQRRLDLIPKVRRSREALAQAEQHCIVLKALVSGYQVKMQAVSRELTRRIAEMRREA